MRAAITEANKTRERLRRQHAANLAECAPLMDHSIPLGLPPVADHFAINRYYAMKHARGGYGTYWPLHKTKTHG